MCQYKPVNIHNTEIFIVCSESVTAEKFGRGRGWGGGGGTGCVCVCRLWRSFKKPNAIYTSLITRENSNSNSNSKTLFFKDCSLGSFRPV